MIYTRRLVFYVLLAHLGLGLFLFSYAPPKPTPPSKVKVHTIVLKQPTPAIIQKPQPKPSSTSAPKPVAQKSQPAAKKSTSKPAPKTARVTASHDKLRSLVAQSLTSLESNNNPSSIPSLKSEAETFAADYQTQLVSYLQHLLHFPEVGNVNIRLTLTRNGNISNVIIINAASDKNRRYIETTLPTLTLPAFGTHFRGEHTHTFSLTLTSAFSH